MTTYRMTPPDPAALAHVVLPPYTGNTAVCLKCCWADALTTYRTTLPYQRTTWNGLDIWRGPLPERLERQCGRCDFQWDEALASPAADIDPLLADPDTIPVPLLITPPVLPPGMEEDVLAMLERCPEADHLSPAQRSDLAARFIAQADVYLRPVGEPPAGGWPTRASRQDLASLLRGVLPSLSDEHQNLIDDTADFVLKHTIVHFRPAVTA